MQHSGLCGSLLSAGKNCPVSRSTHLCECIRTTPLIQEDSLDTQPQIALVGLASCHPVVSLTILFGYPITQRGEDTNYNEGDEAQTR